MGGLRDALRSLAASAAAGLAATPVIIAFTDNVATIACCEGRSMQPTINRIGGMSAVVLLDKWSGRSSRFDRGDVVVLNSPTHDGSMVLKRILALGGDYVKRADGRGEPIHVPKGHCWVEGDNPAVSHDSNAFGPVPVAMVNARVVYKLWPLSEVGPVERLSAPPSRVWHPGRDYGALTHRPGPPPTSTSPAFTHGRLGGAADVGALAPSVEQPAATAGTWR